MNRKIYTFITTNADDRLVLAMHLHVLCNRCKTLFQVAVQNHDKLCGVQCSEIPTIYCPYFHNEGCFYTFVKGFLILAPALFGSRLFECTKMHFSFTLFFHFFRFFIFFVHSVFSLFHFFVFSLFISGPKKSNRRWHAFFYFCLHQTSANNSTWYRYSSKTC